METTGNLSNPIERRTVLSTLWIFVLFNYIYADLVLMIFSPASPRSNIPASDGTLLGFAVFIETAIAMVLLSRLLPYRANRLANILVGLAHAAVITWTLFVSAPPTSYRFSAVLIIACALYTAWFAWNWPAGEGQA